MPIRPISKALRGALAAAASTAFAFAATHAHAHVTLEYEVAFADAPYKAVFGVGHGCGTSPTRQVTVDIPASVRSVRPMPKPGWTVDVQRAGDAVARISWTARTPGDMLAPSHYDEFVLVAQAPAQAGRIEWPVAQVCEQGRAEWKPALEILPAQDTAGGHKH